METNLPALPRTCLRVRPLICKQEVAGSIPAGSTEEVPGKTVVWPLSQMLDERIDGLVINFGHQTAFGAQRREDHASTGMLAGARASGRQQGWPRNAEREFVRDHVDIEPLSSPQLLSVRVSVP
jgi:hypothetical protein